MAKQPIRPTAMEGSSDDDVPLQPSSKPAKSAPKSDDDGTRPFRPFARPPIASLLIADDDGRHGETIRLRTAITTIGRTDADILVPHDDQISGRHAAITRSDVDGSWIWEVQDLNSRNGLFVRCGNIRLRNNSELLMGLRRYRFELPQSAASSESDSVPGMPAGTRGWEKVPQGSLRNLVPCLVAVDGDDIDTSYPLERTEHRIGRDARQAEIVIDDPVLSPLHVVISKLSDGTWQLSDAGSRNGVWLRVQKTSVTNKCDFQLGEQRFQLKLQ